MKHLGDITKIHGYDAPVVNVVIGGSPCQDLSQAGKRAGFDGERSVLFLDQIRVIGEMREEDERNGRTGVDVRPRFMVWENVPGAFSSRKGEDFRAVLEETARVKDPDAVIPGPADGKWRNAGVILGDGWSIAWRVLDAQFWGVTYIDRETGDVLEKGTPQRRRRIVLIADFGGHAAPEILFERSGLSGDSETGGTAWEGTAGDAENGVGAAVICLNDQGGSVMGVSEDVNGTLRAQEHGHQPVVIGCTNRGIACEKTETLRAESHGAIPIVYNEETITSKTNASNPKEGDPCHTLGATGAGRAICIQGNVVDRDANCNGKGWKEEKAFTLNTIDRPAVYDACGNGGGNTAPTLAGDQQNRVTDYSAVCIGNGQADITTHITVEVAQTLNCMHDQMAVMTYQAVTGPLMANSHPGSYTGQDAYNDMLVAHTLKACGNDPHREDAVTYPIQNNTVRRLTPLECERLQGYPDGWTDIGEWVDSKGKKHISSDSARYKALGNSIALPPWRFVLGRLIRYCEEKTMASLFDGIGGFPLIWGELGGETVWASEIEEFPIAVTKRRFGE